MLPPVLTYLLDKLPPAERKKMHQRLRRLFRPAWLGTLRRTRPLSEGFGYDRGTPVDRYYIEAFLEMHRKDIRGHVLEVKDSGYTDRFGTGIRRKEVLDINSENPQATIVADLAVPSAVPSDTFDCFILTQTLQLIYDIRAAIANAHRLLRRGGVLLVTVPSASPIVQGPGLKDDYWRFTPASCRLLFEEAFGSANISVESHGNVLTTIAFLAGMAYEELSRKELDLNDPNFPLIVAVRGERG